MEVWLARCGRCGRRLEKSKLQSRECSWMALGAQGPVWTGDEVAEDLADRRCCVTGS